VVAELLDQAGEMGAHVEIIDAGKWVLGSIESFDSWKFFCTSVLDRKKQIPSGNDRKKKKSLVPEGAESSADTIEKA
jgi:hypothetical protein